LMANRSPEGRGRVIAAAVWQRNCSSHDNRHANSCLCHVLQLAAGALLWQTLPLWSRRTCLHACHTPLYVQAAAQLPVTRLQAFNDSGGRQLQKYREQRLCSSAGCSINAHLLTAS
jgi:hypothetical protein